MFITKEPIFLTDFFTEKPSPSEGASVYFVGTVRNHQDGRKVKRLHYECYEPMAEKQIREMIERTIKEYGINRAHVLHRVGWLEIGDIAVVIRVSAPHREEAFSACRALVEAIKKTAPIWKKEIYEDGTVEWVLCLAAEERIL